MSRKKNNSVKLKSLLEIGHVIVRAEKSNHRYTKKPFKYSQNEEKIRNKKIRKKDNSYKK